MSFREPFGEEINPFTGYPFSTQNLDQRINGLRPDFEKLGYNFDPPASEEIKPPEIKRFKKDVPNESVRISLKIKENPLLPPSPLVKSVFKVPALPARFEVKDQPKIIAPPPAAPDFKRKTASAAAVKPVLAPELKSKPAFAIVKSTLASEFKGKPAPVAVVKPTLAPEFKGKPAPVAVVKPTLAPEFKGKPAPVAVFKPTVAPELKGKPAPVPAKRIKKQYKHSFNFITSASTENENTVKRNNKYHRAAFRLFDDGVKKDVIQKAFKELSEFTKEVWPNPRQLLNDGKVTASTVNEFTVKSIREMLLQKALNDPAIFEAHQSLYIKKRTKTGESFCNFGNKEYQ